MVSLRDVWECLANTTSVPSTLPDLDLREVVTTAQKGGAGRLFVEAGDEALSAESLDGLLDRGTPAVVVTGRLPTRHRVTWVDTAAGGGGPAAEVSLPIGFVVADAEAALRDIAGLWRSRTAAQVLCIVGAEGLRTCQLLVKSVLRQRFQTVAPDVLCCDRRSTAAALLDLKPDSERLLLRVNLGDEETLRFVREVVRPHVVVATNMTVPQTDETLLDLSWERRWVEDLPEDTLLVANVDDPIIAGLAARARGAVFGYGLRSQADSALWASHIESLGKEGLRLRMHYQGDVVHVRVPLLGRYSVHTALAATAVGLASGESWEGIVAGLRAMSAQLHLIMTPGYGGATFLEDTYAASPSSVLSILHLLEEFPGRKVVVLGGLTELAHLEEEGHRKVGRLVAEVAARLIALGPLGRIIADEALASGLPAESVQWVPDHQEAVHKLREIVALQDLVLVSGAGHLGLKRIVDELIDTHAMMCEV